MRSSAPAAIAAIRRAVADVQRRRGRSAIVTNPVAKNVLYRSGFAEPGHTEFLAKLAEEATGIARASGDDAVVARARGRAGHHPPSAARRRRDGSPRDLIVETGRIVARDLRERFGIARPRLAVAGLNPHAGEDGALGERGQRPSCGPRSSGSGRGHRRARPVAGRHDVPRGRARELRRGARMYHDQALIPIKTLAFDHAVNVTLGLPFVRTSPDHGTAFDIAGTGRADPASLIAALRLRRGSPPAREPQPRRAAAHERDRRPAAAARGDPPARPRAPRNRSARISCSISTSPRRIARAAGPLDGVDVVEIGPGPGGLTRALLAAGARRVIAVERDERALAALAEIAARYPGRLEVVAGDALDFDPRPLLGGAPARIVANLPYNIATALLVAWLTLEPGRPGTTGSC